MNWQDRDQRARRRERVAISVLSLLILFTLLGGYAYLRATQEQTGKLAVVSTSQVTISVSDEPDGQAGEASSETPPLPTPTARPTAGGRGPVIASEVLGQQDSPAEAGAASQPVAPATAVATATSPSRTGLSIGTSGLVDDGSSSGGGGTGGGGGGTGGGGSGASPTSTPVPGGNTPTATSAPPGPSRTPAPTRTSAPATSTPVPDVATPFGQNSHLHIDGFAGPGAYTTGGIIVTNLGQVAFNYSLSMSTTGSASFASAIRLRIYLRAGTSCDYPGPPPSPSSNLLPLTGDQSGTLLYDGNFSTGNKFGNPSVEVATGDRFLDVGQSEVLCMEVFFPWTAGNQYQGQSVNGTLIFTAKSPE